MRAGKSETHAWWHAVGIWAFCCSSAQLTLLVSFGYGLCRPLCVQSGFSGTGVSRQISVSQLRYMPVRGVFLFVEPYRVWRAQSTCNLHMGFTVWFLLRGGEGAYFDFRSGRLRTDFPWYGAVIRATLCSIPIRTSLSGYGNAPVRRLKSSNNLLAWPWGSKKHCMHVRL